MSLIVRRLTASGRGAVAVLEVTAGAAVAGLLDEHFRSVSGRRISDAALGKIYYGHWGTEDVVMVRTADDTWEVQCHGGEAAVQKIATDLGGLTLVADRPALHDRLDRLLLKCRTLQTARFVLHQQRVLPEWLKQLRAEMDAVRLQAMADTILSWQPFADHLTDPWKIAVVGRPNVGKSSLVNELAGYERAIVFDQPGTTRDRLEVDIVLQGYPMRLVDTAGIREQAEDTIESEGIRLALESAQQADLCLHIVDAVDGWQSENQSIQNQVAAAASVVVCNKTDLRPAANFSVLPPTFPVVQTSATEKTGLQNLTQTILTNLIPEEPQLSEPLPLLPDLADRLRDLRQPNPHDAINALHDWIDQVGLDEDGAAEV